MTFFAMQQLYFATKQNLATANDFQKKTRCFHLVFAVGNILVQRTQKKRQDVTTSRRDYLQELCWILISNKSMTVSDITIEAKRLGSFFKT